MSVQRASDNVLMIDSPYHGRRGVLGTYLIRGEKTLIIDPGPATQVEGLLEILKRLRVERLDVIALTHIHLDHAAGCWRLLEVYPDALVHCHPRGVEHMIDPSKIQTAAEEAFGEKILEYGEIRGIPKEKVVASKDGEVLELGGLSLSVLWTPGHSTHSQSYYEADTRTVMVGDTVGHTPDNIGYFIPASPQPYNPDQTLDSLNKLEALSPQTLCIGHFGFHQNAVERIRNFSEQVTLWRKIALRGVEEGLSLSEMYVIVKNEDPIVGMMVAVDPESERSVYSSLVGFVSYIKWVKKLNEF